MQILSVSLKNIKSHRETDLSFSPGINVLSGPNGIGKSTIFEAIGYALFGVDARDFVGNIERFLTIGAKKGEVSVVFRTDRDETWRVTRTVGTPSRWLLARESAGGFQVEEHAGQGETETRIAELLGLASGRPLAEQFRLVIGPFQHEFLGPFVIRQATKRQEAFDEILGIDAWRKTYKGTGSLLSAVQERIRVLAAEVVAKEETVAVLPEREAELAAVAESLAACARELRDDEASLLLAAEKVGELDGLRERLDSATRSLVETEARIESGREHIGGQVALVERSETAARQCEESRPGKDAFEKAEAGLAVLRDKERERRSLEQEVAGLEREAVRLGEVHDHEQREVGDADRQMDTEADRLADERAALAPDPATAEMAARLPGLLGEIETARGERAHLLGRRDALLDGRDKLAAGDCPFFGEPCRNLVEAESADVFTGRIDAIERRIGELDKRVQALAIEAEAAENARRTEDARKVRMGGVEKQLQALAERRTRNLNRREALGELADRRNEAVGRVAVRREDLAALGFLDEEITRLEAEREKFRPERDRYQAHTSDAAELEERWRVLAGYRKRLDELLAEREARQAELLALRESYRPEQHEEARCRKETLVGTVAALRQRSAGLETDRDRREREIARLLELKAEIGERVAEKKAWEEKERLVKFLRNQVFRNVSGQLSERFREEISLRADRIYRIIAEADEELVWGGDYRILLRDMANGEVRERSDDQLSGGQIMSAVVALRLALLQTIGARIAFFDEPTSNLDAGRRENLATAFRAIDVGKEEVTEHWYDQLFLISHDVAFTEITDRTITLGGE